MVLPHTRMPKTGDGSLRTSVKGQPLLWDFEAGVGCLRTCLGKHKKVGVVAHILILPAT